MVCSKRYINNYIFFFLWCTLKLLVGQCEPRTLNFKKWEFKAEKYVTIAVLAIIKWMWPSITQIYLFSEKHKYTWNFLFQNKLTKIKGEKIILGKKKRRSKQLNREIYVLSDDNLHFSL